MGGGGVADEHGACPALTDDSRCCSCGCYRVGYCGITTEAAPDVAASVGQPVPSCVPGPGHNAASGDAGAGDTGEEDAADRRLICDRLRDDDGSRLSRANIDEALDRLRDRIARPASPVLRQL
jgi:hypothetical protein